MVIRANGSKKKTNCVVDIGRYLTQKVVRPRKIETLLKKEKHGITFAVLKDNLISNKILIGARTMKSDIFFRLTIAARANVLSTSVNTQQWYHQKDKLSKIRQRPPADISTYNEWLCRKYDRDDKALQQDCWHSSKTN
jgi:hypothetical protein